MAGYSPLYIRGNTTGLVQSRVNSILPNDAYPVLTNAYVFRETIRRKQGYQLLGRLRRIFTNFLFFIGLPPGLTFFGVTNILVNNLGITGQPNATIQPGSIVFTFSAPDAATFTDNGDGTFSTTGIGAPGSFFNYITGTGAFIFSRPTIGGGTVSVSLNYYPNLPVMGLLSKELDNLNNEQLVAFDTVYAYQYSGSGFEEYLPGTTWTGTDYNFFWGTDYWVDMANIKIFWVTNFSGPTGDPIRYTNGVAGTNWVDFAPQIDASGNFLEQCLALLPFRGRLLAFNTWEGTSLAGSIQYPQRIRWAAIGNPFTVTSPIVTAVNPTAWRDDIRGQGGFLDLPTSQAITSVGFVRDNLVIFCERSTWQLRYTGRSIAPFQIEKVNTELGAESTFSAIQFDTSLVGVGDKGIVECDSFSSKRIDVKIPDLVFYFNNNAFGPQRVYGIRDFFNKLAYWIYPYQSDNTNSGTYPNRRLLYNYENDSWAIFTDSLTALGTFQPQSGRTWASFTEVPTDYWESQQVPWVAIPQLFLPIIGGNQQGYVELLDIDAASDVSLYIYNIIGGATIVQLNIPNHNLQDNQIIQILDIVATDPFFALNGMIVAVQTIDPNNVFIYGYNLETDAFDIPIIIPNGTYLGTAQVLVKDNFNITSKKFNFLEEGENIQLGYIDVLVNNTTLGEITLKIFVDYNDTQAVNTFPQNQRSGGTEPDGFFNQRLPTSVVVDRNSTKNWERIFCASRGAFLTTQWTFSNFQMTTDAQMSDVQIDSQIMWIRKAGKQLPIGI